MLELIAALQDAARKSQNQMLQPIRLRKKQVEHVINRGTKCYHWRLLLLFAGLQVMLGDAASGLLQLLLLLLVGLLFVLLVLKVLAWVLHSLFWLCIVVKG